MKYAFSSLSLVSAAKTLEKTKRKTTVQVKQKVEADVESQVVVHCRFTGRFNDDKVRVWKSTFLVARDSEHRSELVSAFNVSMYPEWTILKKGAVLNFTMIFTGLPKSCRSFDFLEIIPQPGGFVKRNIARNQTDVYRILIS